MAANPSTTRRSLLKAGLAAPAVIAATTSHAQGGVDPASYYAFLWHEMERVEEHVGVERLSSRLLDQGRDGMWLFLQPALR